MHAKRWITRRRNVPSRSKPALFVVAVRLAVAAAGGGMFAALPVGHASAQLAPGTTETSGPVTGAPGYSWDVITNSDGTTIVSIFGPGSPGGPGWVSFGGGPWYKNSTCTPEGLCQGTLADASSLPSFLNPDADPTAYGSFVAQILPSLAPQPLPEFPAPASAPPTLDTTDPATDPGSGDPGGGSGDPGGGSGDPGGGSGDPGGGSGDGGGGGGGSGDGGGDGGGSGDGVMEDV